MKRNKGFTLVELLMVIVIIGVLTSAILAGIQSTKTKTPVEEKQECLDKINMDFRLNDLPARCLKYVEMPGKMTFPTEERW